MPSDSQDLFIVSDSEDDGEELELSQQALEDILSRNVSGAITRTSVLRPHLYRVIEDTRRRVQRSSVSVDDLFDDESGNTQPPRQAPSPTVTSPVPVPEIRETPEPFESSDANYSTRGTRTRTRSFYQQHIYTIDQVAYLLKLDLEEATELVKKDPVLIEKFHEGGLRDYLLGRDSSKKQKQKKVSRRPQVYLNPLPDVPEETQREVEMVPSQNTIQPVQSDSDDEEYSDDSEQSSPESEVASDNDSEEPVVVFRGKTYKNLEELSRGSRLPKLFFSMQAKSVPRTKKTQKRVRVVEDRAGVAKKKMRPAAFVTGETLQSSDAPKLDGVFTTGEDSQEVQGTQKEFDWDIPASPKNSVHNPLLEEFLNEDESLSFGGDTQRFHRVYQPVEEDYGEALEDRSSGLDHMLAPRERSKKSTSSSGTRKRSTAVKTKRFERRRAGTTTSSTAHVPRPKKQSTITAATKSASKPRQSNPSSTKKTPKKQRALFGLTQPRTVSIHDTLDYLGAHVHKTDDETIEAIKTTKTPKKQAKIKPSKYFFLKPGPNAILPRQAASSTVVYETLSHEYAVIPRKIPNAGPHIVNIDDGPPPGYYPFSETSMSFKAQFRGSSAYKCLFTDERIDTNHEYRIKLGKRTVVISRVLQNTEEKFKEVFEALTDGPGMRSASPDSVIEACNLLIECCSSLEVHEAKTLVTMTDNFRLKLESFIRRKGHMKDLDFYFLSLCYMLYFCSFKVFEDNYLTLFDFEIKARDIATLFFEFVSYIGGAELRNKIRVRGLFLEALSMLFVTHESITWDVIRTAKLNDLELFKEICVRYEPEKEQWGVVRDIMKQQIQHGMIDKLRRGFTVIDELVNQLGWPIDDETLLVMYEVLRENMFRNFAGEPRSTVILTENGINQDTMLNIYLNMLIEYGHSGGAFSGRFLEKIIPISKTPSDVETFCNRLNIILALVIASKRNLDMKFSDLMVHCEFGSNIVMQRAFQAFGVLVRVNNSHRVVTKMAFLEPLIEKLVKNDGFSHSWKAFVDNVDFLSLIPATQKSILKAISAFSDHKEFFRCNTTFLHEFISNTEDDKTLIFLRDTFNELNPSLFPDLWCFLFGKLVIRRLDNWSRLIHFNNFKDEPRMYAFMIQNSSVGDYMNERDTYILSMINHLVRRKYTSSLNAFIREISRVDPKVMNCKHMLIQTHRLQITTHMVYNFIKSDTEGFGSRFLSVLVNFVKKEYESALKTNDQHYVTFAQKVIEFLSIYGYEKVRYCKAFEQMCDIFNLSKRPVGAETSSLLSIRGNLKETLRFMEDTLIKSFKSADDFTTIVVDAIFKHPKRPFGSADNISESKLYPLCCSISSHIELLAWSPSCWILLSELTKALSFAIENDRNLTRIDIFCLMKTLKLFPVALKSRKSRYESFELLTLKHIYQILVTTFFLLDGTNDMQCLIDSTIQLTSSEAIYEIITPIEIPQFLHKTPSFIKDMILKANLTGSDRVLRVERFREEVDGLFNKFTALVETVHMNEEDYLYVDDV